MLPSGSNIVVRVDASSEIGVGHVMRCLTLADRLASVGCRVSFVCREYAGHLQSLIEEKGHDCFLLAVPSGRSEVSRGSCVSHQRKDADEFIEALAQFEVRPSWVICDHYALDQVWHNLVRPYADRLMVIDDLANRQYRCELLLDPTLGRSQADYIGKVPPECRLLLGTDYALLRSEFTHFRSHALIKREEAVSEFRILVTMGGADPQNATAIILRSLELLEAPERLFVDVVMGGSARHLREVCSQADASRLRMRVHANVKNMAALMLAADLAIGASGGTSWERCCLGLPSLLVVLADNQRNIAQALTATGAARNLGDCATLREEDVAGEVRDLLEHPARLRGMAQSAFSVCDGLGGLRSLLVLTDPVAADGLGLSLRAVSIDDAKLIYEWQKHPDTRRFARNPKPPSWEQHEAWMQAKLAEPNCYFYMVMHGSTEAGILRLDPLGGESDMEVSIFVAPDKYRLGIGLVGLRLLRLFHPDINIYAHIMVENIASQRVFESAGYERVDDTNLVCRAIC